MTTSVNAKYYYYYIIIKNNNCFTAVSPCRGLTGGIPQQIPPLLTLLHLLPFQLTTLSRVPLYYSTWLTEATNFGILLFQWILLLPYYLQLNITIESHEQWYLTINNVQVCFKFLVKFQFYSESISFKHNQTTTVAQCTGISYTSSIYETLLKVTTVLDHMSDDELSYPYIITKSHFRIIL